jgi:hypothetical protein
MVRLTYGQTNLWLVQTFFIADLKKYIISIILSFPTVRQFCSHSPTIWRETRYIDSQEINTRRTENPKTLLARTRRDGAAGENPVKIRLDMTEIHQVERGTQYVHLNDTSLESCRFMLSVPVSPPGLSARFVYREPILLPNHSHNNRLTGTFFRIKIEVTMNKL